MNRIYRGKFSLKKSGAAKAPCGSHRSRLATEAARLFPTILAQTKRASLRSPLFVQELRFLSGLSCDLRSLADRFLRTADTAGFDLVQMKQ